MFPMGYSRPCITSSYDPILIINLTVLLVLCFTELMSVYLYISLWQIPRHRRTWGMAGDSKTWNSYAQLDVQMGS